MTKKTAYIHIGQHKTGTTTLQTALTKFKISKNIYVPSNFLVKKGNKISHFSHAEFVWYMMGDKNRIKKTNFNISSFKKEIKNKKKIFISCEDISLLLTNKKTKKKFENFFKSYDINYIVFIRNTNDKYISLVRQITSYKNINKIYRKILQLKYFYLILFKGYFYANMFKTKNKFYFITDYKKYIKNIKKHSRGKFYFFSYNNDTDIINQFYKLGILKERKKIKRLNSRNKNYFGIFFYKFFKTDTFFHNKVNEKIKLKKIFKSINE